MDDRERLEALAHRRDRRAFAELCREHGGRIAGFFRRRGVPDDAVEELVQEVFVSVWLKAATYDPNTASPSTWIFAIARNKAIDRLRRFARAEVDPRDPALVGEPAPGLDEAVASTERAARLRAALERLPDPQAEVIRATYLDGLSMPELAERTGVALGTIKSRMRLALAALRRRLDSDGGDHGG